jgi:quinol monooxygenase YgiN
MAHRERWLKSESGTLQFEVLGPRDDDGRVLFNEDYSNDAAFKVHWKSRS